MCLFYHLGFTSFIFYDMKIGEKKGACKVFVEMPKWNFFVLKEKNGSFHFPEALYKVLESNKRNILLFILKGICHFL